MVLGCAAITGMVWSRVVRPLPRPAVDRPTPLVEVVEGKPDAGSGGRELAKQDAALAPEGKGSDEVRQRGQGQASSPALKINPNTASKAELELLPGVGPALAERIMAERERSPFATLEDLDRVRGIGAKTLEQLREHLRFD